MINTPAHAHISNTAQNTAPSIHKHHPSTYSCPTPPRGCTPGSPLGCRPWPSMLSGSRYQHWRTGSTRCPSSRTRIGSVAGVLWNESKTKCAVLNAKHSQGTLNHNATVPNHHPYLSPKSTMPASPCHQSLPPEGCGPWPMSVFQGGSKGPVSEGACDPEKGWDRQGPSLTV